MASGFSSMYCSFRVVDKVDRAYAEFVNPSEAYAYVGKLRIIKILRKSAKAKRSVP